MSGTRACKCYYFTMGDLQVRLIDTPGIADTGGLSCDGVNMQNLLNFISHYKEIDGICVVLNPNDSRVPVVFKYCILQLLTYLEKSASSNILFLFTNARSTFYKPGDVAPGLLQILQAIKDKPPYVTIPFAKDNTFCVDNEAFRFLVASSPPNNITSPTAEKEEFSVSWFRSTKECQRLLQYVFALPPHQVENTVSLNKARRSVQFLCQPLGNIAKYIAYNVKILEDHKKKISEWRGDIKELQKNLYTPAVEVTSASLQRPRTVCGHEQCCDKINVNGMVSMHYKTICHSPCYLESSDGSVIGNTGLLDCMAFNTYVYTGTGDWCTYDELHPDFEPYTPNKKELVWAEEAERHQSEYCTVCKHSYQNHLHVFTKTKVKRKKVRGDIKYSKITNRKDAVKSQQVKIKELSDAIKHLTAEALKIMEHAAKFAHFLRSNALTPFNDAFEEYLEHLICNERSGLNLDIENQGTVKGLEKLVENYRFEKDILEEAMKAEVTCEEVSARCIEDCIEELCMLKICGPMIYSEYILLKEMQNAAHKEHNEVHCEVPVSEKSWWNEF